MALWHHPLHGHVPPGSLEPPKPLPQFLGAVSGHRLTILGVGNSGGGTVPPELGGDGGSIFGGPHSGVHTVGGGVGAGQPPPVPAPGTPNALRLPRLPLAPQADPRGSN